MLSPQLRRLALGAGLTLSCPVVASSQTAPGSGIAPMPSATVVVPHGAVAPGKTPQWPVTVPGAAGLPTQAEAQADAGWTKQEIADEQSHCAAVLAKYEATVEPVPAIREGECGAPYPVQLTAIGKVQLSQPAIVTCRVIEGLGEWMKSDVQPAAKRHLGASVTRIDVMSSYSCRNAYGRKRTKLSEHGRANALDIKSFALSRGKAVDLVADWGLTERDVKARIAAAEAQARALAAARAKAEAEAKAVAEAQARARASARALAERNARPSGDGEQPNFSTNGMAVLRGMVPDTIGRSSEDQGGNSSALTLGQPTRLGGPKSKSDKSSTATAPVTAPSGIVGPSAGGLPAAAPASGAQKFLREIHVAACKRFGTVLGPEANEAHRNHFHLDMAERNGRGSFCE